MRPLRVRARAHEHHAGSRRCREQREELAGQQERGEVIHRELHLDAVDALRPPEGEAAGVVDQHVEPCLACRGCRPPARAPRPARRGRPPRNERPPRAPLPRCVLPPRRTGPGRGRRRPPSRRAARGGARSRNRCPTWHPSPRRSFPSSCSCPVGRGRARGHFKGRPCGRPLGGRRRARVRIPCTRPTSDIHVRERPAPPSGPAPRTPPARRGWTRGRRPAPGCGRPS